MLKEKLLFRKARPIDMAYIRAKAQEWRLDDEDTLPAQFTVVENEESKVIGFGRIKKYPSCYELGTVGVAPEWRGRGIGRGIIERLISEFPSKAVWITTDLADYFSKFGFQAVISGPSELLEKISSACRIKGRQCVQIMLLRKPLH